MREFASINKYVHMHEYQAVRLDKVKHETSLFNLGSSCLNGRDSSVGILTGYGLDDRGSIPDRRKRFYLLHSV
jgi:hypothetical protein